MNFKLKDKDGLVLATKNKYCTHNLKIVPKLEDKTFTENGVYPVPDGYAGHGEVTASVYPNLEPLEITKYGTYTCTPSEEAYGFSDINVNFPIESLVTNKNGVYISSEDGYTSMSVSVKTLDDMFGVAQNKAQGQKIPISDLGLFVASSDKGYYVNLGTYATAVYDKIDSILNGVLSSMLVMKQGIVDAIIVSSGGDYYACYDTSSDGSPWRINIIGDRDSSGSYLAKDIYIVFIKPGTYYVFVDGEAKAKYIVT